MIQTIWVSTAYGDRLDLNMRTSEAQHGLLIFNIDGLGPPVATVSGSGGPSFDGVRMNSVRTDSRQIIISLAITAKGDKEEDARELIYRSFPIKGMIIFGVITDRRIIYIEAIVESNDFSQFAAVENGIISLNCPKPFFRDFYDQTYSFGINIGLARFSFPFSNESLVNRLILFGEHLEVPGTEINYIGGIETGMNINLLFSGPATEISLTNTNGNQMMVINSPIVIQNGDSIRINTKVGEKSINLHRGLTVTNILRSVSVSTRWLSIRPGLNTIRMTSTTGIDNIAVDVIFTPLRQGV